MVKVLTPNFQSLILQGKFDKFYLRNCPLLLCMAMAKSRRSEQRAALFALRSQVLSLSRPDAATQGAASLRLPPITASVPCKPRGTGAVIARF